MNSNSEEKQLKTDRFREMTGAYPQAIDIVTKQTLNDIGTITIAPNNTIVLELR